MQAIDRNKYEVVPIGITKQGLWLRGASAEALLHSASPAGQLSAAPAIASSDAVLMPPLSSDAGQLVPFSPQGGAGIHLDVIFPVLHGTFGEDGTIQGLFELADVAYVGSGVLGSAAGMDKDAMKKMFAYSGLPLVKHVTIRRAEWEKQPQQVTQRIAAELTYPVFVKPANLGSSVGISKAHNAAELPRAIDEAARFDRKIVIEQGVGGRQKAREIECGVLGNDEPLASVCGEIVPAAEFYDYDAKYNNAASELLIPAPLSEAQQNQVRQMAVRAFSAVDCAGLARVDFLMDPVSGEFFLNEVNTMPGFTAISMYPKLWAASGVSYVELIDRLIQLALARQADKRRNRYSKD